MDQCKHWPHAYATVSMENQALVYITFILRKKMSRESILEIQLNRGAGHEGLNLVQHIEKLVVVHKLDGSSLDAVPYSFFGRIRSHTISRGDSL